MDDDHIPQLQNIIEEWGIENYRDFPWRAHNLGWHGLIAEILLQRTRAENVIPVFNQFKETYKTPDELANSSTEEVKNLIYPLGLLWRAPLLVELGRELVSLGSIPDTYEELLKLPGVGPYVAAAWLSFYANGRGVLIDANIVRWVCRILDKRYDGETRRKRWLKEFMETLTPAFPVRSFNYALLDFCMLVCKARTPDCSNCPFNKQRLCVFSARLSF